MDEVSNVFHPFLLVQIKLSLQGKLEQKLNKNTNETVHYLSTLEFIKKLPTRLGNEMEENEFSWKQIS